MTPHGTRTGVNSGHPSFAFSGQDTLSLTRVMTDNAFAYLSRAFRGVCQLRGVRPLRTRPYTPRTNGEAERFTRPLLTEWAYARPCPSSTARTAGPAALAALL
jgi:transposase InsO family protein